MFDIFKRMSNAVFTSSENYGVKVNVGGANSYMSSEDSVNIADADFLVGMGLKRKEAVDVLMQASLHEGAHIKLSTTQPLEDLAASATNAHLSDAQYDMLGDMVNIVEDMRVDTAIARDRPGYADLRKQGNKIAFKLFKDNPSGDKNFDTMKAVSFKAVGIDLKKVPLWDSVGIDWDEVNRVAKDLTDIAEASDSTTDAVQRTYDYYNNTYCDGKLPPMVQSSKQTPPKLGNNSRGNQQGGGDGQKSEKSDGQSDGSEESDGSESGGSGSGDGDSDKSKQDKQDARDGGSDKDGSGKSDNDKEKKTSKELSTGGVGAGKGTSTPQEILKTFEGKNGLLQKMMGERATKNLKQAKKNKQDTREEQNKRAYEQQAKEVRDLLNRQYKNMWTPAEEAAYIPQIATGVNAGAEPAYLMYKDREHETTRGLDDYRAYVTRKTSHASILKALDSEARLLGAKLAQELRASRDDKGEIAKSGSKLIVNKLWKPLYTGSTDVFWRPELTEVGGYVVDVLLDASGSQSSNRNKIRAQAYILAEACSIAGITCRVSLFQSSSEFTKVLCLKNYDEPKELNRHVFGYIPGGDNRDGVAIRTANIELQKRPEQNKILMVLSDGSPANSSNKIGAFGGNRYYGGGGLSSVGVSDVNRAVRDIRASGTAVMGVYVASSSGDEVLNDEKCMYGNDFAYITDMKIFVPTVMRYLSKHIRSFEV